jgi:AcrR family transcriptional regulator
MFRRKEDKPLKRTKNSSSETPARILEAADGLFCDRGFEAVSMAEVARLAEVNKALVFYHFGSKAALFERVLERYYRAHREALEEAFAGGGELGERLHRVIDAYIDFMTANQRYARLIQQQVAGVETHALLIERNLAPLFEWTTRALATATPAEGPLSARHFFVTFSGMVINYFTYAPVLAPLWGTDPLRESALAERRAHVHWMVDVVLGRLGQAQIRPSSV